MKKKLLILSKSGPQIQPQLLMGRNTVAKILGISIILFSLHFFSSTVLLVGTLLFLIFSIKPHPGQCIRPLIPCGWSLGGNTPKFEFRLIGHKGLHTSNSVLPVFFIELLVAYPKITN